MSSSVATLGHHMLASRTLLTRRSVQIAIAVAAIATILSVVLAPNTSPTTWDWIRFILIGIIGTLAVLTFTLAQVEQTDSAPRQQQLIASGVLFAIALFFNLTFGIETTILFSIGITIVALMTAGDRDLRSSWMITGSLIAIIPFWVWSALEAWTWGLMLLIPLAAIAIISDGHMRAAMGMSEETPSLLSPRAHRLACWAGVLGSALIALVTGMLTNASNGVVALGAVGAVLLIALAAGTPSTASGGPRRSVSMCDAALIWVALCWIVSL